MTNGRVVNGGAVSLHVCRAPSFNWRRQAHCPTCERRRWFLISEGGYWGSTRTCLGCGDAWDGDGYRMERPFSRGWRTRSIQRAKSTPYMKKADAMAGLLDYLLDVTVQP